MKDSIYVMAVLAMILSSCHGGNMNTEVPNGVGDTLTRETNASSLSQNTGTSAKDSNRSSSNVQVDSTNITQSTDTAPYHRKFSKEDSARLKAPGSAGKKINKSHY